MRWRTVAILLAAAVVPMAQAQAEVEIGEPDNGFSKLDERYIIKWELCWQKFKQQCGANLLASAWSDAEPVSEDRIANSLATIERWLNPPEPEPVVYAAEDYAGGYEAPSYEAVPASSTVECESGGDYSANTGNGYYGGWQFDSQTWDAYGDPAYAEANEAPPAVQDAAAASVPYDAWPNC
jgi:hypothetical protein